MRTVGYRQCWEYLDGQIDLDTFREKAVAATRQLAKRQLTWLRGTPGLVWMDASHPCAPSCLLRFLDSAIESRQFSQNRVTNQ